MASLQVPEGGLHASGLETTFCSLAEGDMGVLVVALSVTCISGPIVYAHTHPAVICALEYRLLLWAGLTDYHQTADRTTHGLYTPSARSHLES